MILGDVLDRHKKLSRLLKNIEYLYESENPSLFRIKDQGKVILVYINYLGSLGFCDVLTRKPISIEEVIPLLSSDMRMKVMLDINFYKYYSDKSWK